MDRDESSIGGVENPMQPTKELLYITIIMDIISIILSFLISVWFAYGLIAYIIFSHLYSCRSIRLKRFAILGYLTVVLNQGILIFLMIYHGSSQSLSLAASWHGWVAAGFLIGGFYPITQIYQHEADAKDRVKTISILLGKKGTFIFCGIMYVAAFSILFFYFNQRNEIFYFFLIQIFFIPVLLNFFGWGLKVWKNGSAANFKYAMQMNFIASTCSSCAFIVLLILRQRG